MLIASQFVRPVLNNDGRTNLATSRPSAPRSKPKTKQPVNNIKRSFGILDGFSISYSMIRCCFDVMCAKNVCFPADRMHDWMMTPTGFAVAITESIALVSVSVIANTTDDADQDQLKRFIADKWPYFRDAFKAMKNTYRSIGGIFQVYYTLTEHDLREFAPLVGVLLGAISMGNRCMVRYTRDQRGNIAKLNAALLELVEDSIFFTPEQCVQFRDQINYEKTHLRALSFVGAIYSGLVDGIYLYMGIVSLASLSPFALMIAVSISLGFSLLCIVSRIYEIYIEQRVLEVTQAKIKLVLCGKELHGIFMQLKAESGKEPVNQVVKAGLVEAFNQKLEEFDERRAYLHSRVTQSYFLAGLAGMRGGLAAYGVVTSLLFAVSTVTTLLFMPFPPALVFVAIIAGLGCLVGYISHSLLMNYSHRQEQKEYTPQLKSKLSELDSVIENEEAEARQVIHDEMLIVPSPQELYQQWFEIWRSLFSGLSKGQKSVDFLFFWLQQKDEQGHYRDTPFMYVLMLLSTALFSWVLSSRAADNYDRDNKQNKINYQQLEFIKKDEKYKPSGRGESATGCTPSADSPPRNRSSTPPATQTSAPPNNPASSPITSMFNSGLSFFGCQQRKLVQCEDGFTQQNSDQQSLIH